MEQLNKKMAGECSATFVVRVNKKPGEPWKGNVIWISERCEQNFDSMQELFALMNDTLENPPQVVAPAKSSRKKNAKANAETCEQEDFEEEEE